MQMILALTASVACAALGTLYSRRLRDRDTLVRRWGEALESMESAVLRGCDLVQVLLSFRESVFLKQAAARLDACPTESPAEWAAALPWEEGLLPRERETLAQCLRGLTAPNQDMQLLSLRSARRQWQDVMKESRRAKDAWGTLAVKLGWLSGAALFILMC